MRSLASSRLGAQAVAQYESHPLDLGADLRLNRWTQRREASLSNHYMLLRIAMATPARYVFYASNANEPIAFASDPARINDWFANIPVLKAVDVQQLRL